MTRSQDSDRQYVEAALPAFVAEAREQLGAAEQLLLALEDAPGDRELLDALFRCAHTVKGSAGIFGLDEVVGFTHHVETLLDRLRDGRLALTPALGTLLLSSNDIIGVLVDAAVGSRSVDRAACDELVARLQAAAGPGEAEPAPVPASGDPAAGGWHLRVGFGAETFRNGMDPLALLNYLGGLGTLASMRCDEAAIPTLDALDPERCHLGFEFDLEGAVTPAQIDSAFEFVRDDATIERHALGRAATAAPAAPAPAPEAAAAAPVAAAPAPSAEQRVIRVQADRLDAVINLVGELVIASAGASLLAHQNGDAALVEANAQVKRLVEEIRNGALQMRMVPIGETFARFRRVVRDTAGQLGKDVQLEISGGDTELDKSMVERIADPLTHLVRNALDHGLETPQERVAAGKPAQGRVALEASHESGSIVIRIADDGRGIQRRKVLERAWERGLVERGTTPPDAAVLDLIFEPGFSTAEQVTNLSGRGVGMDVVRRNVEALRGHIHLDSVEGQGSTIEIRLPLTLAIIDGFLVGVGASKFVFPLDTVVEVIEGPSACGRQDARGRSIVELRGQVLPVLDLRRLYQLDSAEPPRASIVVIQSGLQRYGVRVDSLLGQQQTVIKPLGRMFRTLRGISGSSILGNGEVALIFDAGSLAHLAADATDAGRTAGATLCSSQGPTP